MEKDKIIIIVGPTAVGKTNLSIKLAKTLNGEIISGDSMQIYRGLDVGTAKVTSDEKEDIPHHLIDIRDRNEGYSASDFKEEAEKVIKGIIERKRIPIIAGGTGLYIESLIYDVTHGGVNSKNEAYRKQLEQRAEKEGREVLWQELQKKDPEASKKIHPNNIQRLIRALEVIYVTGKPFSSFQNERDEENKRYDTFIIGLNTERELLYKRINLRVDAMMAQNLEAEARLLYDEGLTNSQAGKGIGYREFYPYFEGNENLEEVVTMIKQNSRRYAKRQLTWFNNRTPVNLWLDLIQEPKQLDEAIVQVRNYLGEDEYE